MWLMRQAVLLIALTLVPLAANAAQFSVPQIVPDTYVLASVR
jgi:hypothetical protein